jgi:NAD(P)-dependent dehydrogenase (short-subunit alcohol dehydrogenase family)
MTSATPQPELIEQLFSLAGRTAIVTGASRGIGWALADGLARAGATVFAYVPEGDGRLHLEAGAAHVFQDMAELPGLLA